jgi:hypothetical protein
MLAVVHVQQLYSRQESAVEKCAMKVGEKFGHLEKFTEIPRK